MVKLSRNQHQAWTECDQLRIGERTKQFPLINLEWTLSQAPSGPRNGVYLRGV